MLSAFRLLRIVPVPLHGASMSTLSNGYFLKLRPSFFVISVFITPSRCVFIPSAASLGASASLAIITPVFFMIAASCVVLLPGLAHISSTRSPGCGWRMIGGSMLAGSWMYISPRWCANKFPMSSRSPLIQNASLHHGTGVSFQPLLSSSSCTSCTSAFRVFTRIARRKYVALQAMNSSYASFSSVW